MFKKQTPKTKEQARQYAINWQSWVSEQNTKENPQSLYMSELIEWQNHLEAIAKKFHLVREFKENGII